jgi:hypothetical protein
LGFTSTGVVWLAITHTSSFKNLNHVLMLGQIDA